MTSPVSTAVPGSSAPAGRRLASSVRLPWLVGLSSLLVLCTVLGLLAGRDTSQAGVQRAALEAQQAVAAGSAQQVRRSLNEASDDLEQLAAALEARRRDDEVPADVAGTLLSSNARWHERWSALALVDAGSGEAVATGSGLPAPEPAEASLPTDRVRTVVLADGRILQSAPLGEGSGLAVAAVYDPAYLYPNLFPRPGALYVVDDQERVVAAPGAQGLGEPLPSPVLREAARDARRFVGTRAAAAGAGSATVVAHAPVTGFGPASDAGLGVVLVDDVPPGGVVASYRVSGALTALGVGGLAALLFWWLHVAVVRPVLELQVAAERVGFGDLSRPVAVDRYDEVGATARALERLRLALIRARVQDVSAGPRPASEEE